MAQVCVGKFKGQGCLGIASGGSHFCAQVPQAGPLCSEPQFSHLEDRDDPNAQNEGLGRALTAQTVKRLFCLNNGSLADTDFPFWVFNFPVIKMLTIKKEVYRFPQTHFSMARAMGKEPVTFSVH